MLFLPYVNVTSARVSWLVAMCGVMMDTSANPRSLRASMVLRMVVSAIIAGRTPSEVEMRHAGCWVQNSGCAAMVHYFSSKGAAALLANMVRRPDLAMFYLQCARVLTKQARLPTAAARVHVVVIPCMLSSRMTTTDTRM